MKTIAAIVIALSAAAAVPARADNWTTYHIPEAGTSVDIPSSIFTEQSGKPDGYGQQFRTSDGSADLTVQAVRRQQGVSPAAFLAAKQPPSGIVYKRIAPDFFRACVPTTDVKHVQCFFIDTKADPPTIRRDPDTRPNAEALGP